MKKPLKDSTYRPEKSTKSWNFSSIYAPSKRLIIKLTEKQLREQNTSQKTISRFISQLEILFLRENGVFHWGLITIATIKLSLLASWVNLENLVHTNQVETSNKRSVFHLPFAKTLKEHHHK